MEPVETNPEQTRISEPFSFFAGPAAWALQLFIGYGLSGQACIAGTKLWIHLVSGAAALVVLAAVFLTYRDWRSYSLSNGQASRGMLLEIDNRVSRQEFVAISGALLSSVFLLLVLMTWGRMIFLNPCPVITMPLP